MFREGPGKGSRGIAWLVVMLASFVAAPASASAQSGASNPPNTIIDSATVVRGEVTLYFSSTGPNPTFRCRSDEVEWTACTPPWTTIVTSGGMTTFEVESTDQYGLTDPTPAQTQFFVDLFPPDTRLLTAPWRNTSSRYATFEFDGSGDVVAFECSLDAVDEWLPCQSNFSQKFSRLRDGAHEFQVRAVDAQGNADATPYVYNWQIDTVGPAVELLKAPPAVTKKKSATFLFTAEDATDEESRLRAACRLNSEPLACTPGEPLRVRLEPGRNVFAVTIKDRARNRVSVVHRNRVAAPR